MEGTKNTFNDWVKAHISLLGNVFLVLLVAVLLFLLYSFYSGQKELKAEIQHQAEFITALQNQSTQDSATLGEEGIPVITSSQLKEQLGSMRELVTQQYIYRNADKYENDQKWIFGWQRPFSGKSLLITYDGSIKAGVDLSNTEIDINEETRTITVTLPASTVTDNNIPQESIEIVEVKNGFFNDVTFDNYNDFISTQKVAMEEKAREMGLLENADEEAEKMVKSFLSLIPGMDTYTLIIKQVSA